jgi:hypothetical protein
MLSGALIYHKLKHPSRFSWLRNNTRAMAAGRTWDARDAKRHWPHGPILSMAAGRFAVFGRKSARELIDLQHFYTDHFARHLKAWQYAQYPRWSHWRDIPPSASGR